MSDSPALPHTRWKNPLIFSLDVSSVQEADSWVQRLAPEVGMIKVGPRLVVPGGQAWLRTLVKQVPVFVDMKFFDIPSTVTAALDAVFSCGVQLATVHALGGQRMLLEARQVQKCFPGSFVVAVTMLTSWSEEDLVGNFQPWPIKQHVEQLMGEVKQAGLTYVVCSPREASIARSLGLLPLTPGVRGPDEPADDQRRTLSPFEALKAGACGLIMGRSLLRASHPSQYVREIVQSLPKLTREDGV